MFKHRSDGYFAKSADPILGMTSHIMQHRYDAMVQFLFVERCDAMDEYIRKKAEQGIRINYMHILIASLVRLYAEKPKINRFVMNGRVFQRKGIYICFAIKKQLNENAPEDTIKMKFTGEETLLQIKDKIDSEIYQNRRASNDTEKAAKLLKKIPNGITKFVVNFCKFLDIHGALPKKLINVSPFHTGCWVTNMKSISTDYVYHHLYDFGTSSMFVGLGKEHMEPVFNEETEAYRNDIEQIRKDLYQEVKTSVDKNYKAKYNQLYEVQKSQDFRQEILDKQKAKQDKTELLQQQKAEELSEREKNVSTLEAEKKAVEEKEKDISAREEQIKIDAAANHGKETDLEKRESSLAADRKELNDAVEKYNEEYSKADDYFKQQQKIFDDNQDSMLEYRKEYREKSTKINEWEEALSFAKDNDTDAWIDSEFNNTFQKKQDTKTLIQKIKQGVKGFIAKIKHMYDEKIRKYERQLNGYDFKDEKGNPMHNFGTAEIQTMFVSEASAKTFRQIADDMDAEGVNNYAELHERKPKYLERHFEYARERTRENTIHY